ncbi:MAG TPA: metallophosphoesterase [Polyangiaceae bacterium]|nr:metallophosphoesterase [Polyangiaceae bacterium]
MLFSLLHLSDLHRDLADEIETGTLLDSLERDLERHSKEDPAILRPSLAVVTGDMVYGASPRAPAPNDELRRQYAQSLEFLEGLARRFFGGERERVVILPGNHDISLPAVRGCVEQIATPVDSAAKARLVEELFTPRSRLRWSWRDLCFYRIADEDAYLRRLEHFATLYSSFYEGTREFPLDPARQFDVFDFADLGFCVITLSSCHNNDPFRRAGAFHPSAVTEVSRLARAPIRAGRLIASAWHHNLSGGPAQDDYLDSGALQLFIDSGISLAMHGHQHLTDCVDERYRVGPDLRKITIVSAGTLCAGPHHLAPGEPRAFNVLELNTDTWTGRVHQRRMVNRTHNLPIWGPGHFDASNLSHVDFGICRPTNARPTGLDLNLTLERAEKLVGAQRWSDAIELLRSYSAVPIARLLLARALSEIPDARQTIDLLSPAVTNAEAILIGGAVYEAGTRKDAEAFLMSPIMTGNNDASVREIAERVRKRRAL